MFFLEEWSVRENVCVFNFLKAKKKSIWKRRVTAIFATKELENVLENEPEYCKYCESEKSIRYIIITLPSFQHKSKHTKLEQIRVYI